MRSRTAVVTGAASGIGLALTRRLLREGWAVAAAVRRAMPDDPELQASTGEGRLRVYAGDLADAEARRDLVARIAASEPKIDCLFNNAGVSTGSLQFSPQGRELHYEVNCIAPYVLLQGLVENLAASGGARVVNTTSSALAFDKRFDPGSLARPARFKVATGPYASTKLALALWSLAIAPSLAERGVKILSVAPGFNATPMTRGPGLPAPVRLLARLIAKPPTHGADLLLDAAHSSHPSGSLVMKRRVCPLPFVEQAERTLEIVAAAASA